MEISEALKTLDLFNVEFRAMAIAHLLYPSPRYEDSEGRVYNHSVPAVARRLRKTSGVYERRHGVFYAFRDAFV